MFRTVTALCALLFILLCTLVSLAAQAQGVEIKADGAARHITTNAYEAIVAANGSLTSLRIGGQEFLQSTVSISRGTYFFQNGVVEMPVVQQEGDAAISAKGERASIRYAFRPDTITCTVTNDTAAPMQFFFVLDPLVNAMMNDQGVFSRPALTQAAQTTTWFRGKSRLRLSGSDRLWGPWEGNTQVWEATLKPRETRQIVMAIGSASDAELQGIQGLGAPTPPANTDLLLLSPKNYQVFQRRTKTHGQIVFTGRVMVPCERLETRITGRSIQGLLPGHWITVPLNNFDKSFDAELPLSAGGWYKVELRAMIGPRMLAQTTVDNVGVGEVFVGAGQSNSTNYGETHTSPTSGMVSTFSGTDWRIANDPQPGVHDKSQGGSFWPAFGDALYTRYHVPIGVATTGHGGTSVNQWQPGGELFQWTLTRIHQLGRGGFRAVLWHQGETDTGMSTGEYADRLTNVIQASVQEAGWYFPWFVAQVSYHNPNDPATQRTRDAQKRLWDTGVALEGPDTDTLTGDNRDSNGAGIHLSAKGLHAHGQMWADKVAVYLDRVLAQ